MKKFKDACDNCGKFDVCKGHKDKILCPSCLNAEEKENGTQNPTP